MLILGTTLTASGQQATTGTKDTTQVAKNSFYGFPLVFYSPETNLGFGAAGIFAFRFRDELPSSQPSQLQMGFAYTLKKQVLLYFPFQLYYQNQKYYSYGELGYYRYIYKFFGVGNHTNPDVVENYSVIYPRIRLNFLQRVHPGLYIGLRYWYEDFNITQLDPEGKLIKGDISGSSGGVTSGPGVVGIYDTRDNVFFPQHGLYAEAVIQTNAKATGSDFYYLTYSLDVSRYFLLEQLQHVVAVNLYSVSMRGCPPFNQLAMLGGSKKMRGYFEGMFRERDLLLLQAEYRAPIVWRLGLVGFISYGSVFHQWQDMQLAVFHLAGGGGLRFLLDKAKKINIRLDAGFGKKSSGFYLTIGEAF